MNKKNCLGREDVSDAGEATGWHTTTRGSRLNVTISMSVSVTIGVSVCSRFSIAIGAAVGATIWSDRARSHPRIGSMSIWRSMPILVPISVGLAIALSSFMIDDAALLIVLHPNWASTIWSILSSGSEKSLERVVIRTLTGLGSRIVTGSLGRENVGSQIVLHLPWSGWRGGCW